MALFWFEIDFFGFETNFYQQVGPPFIDSEHGLRTPNERINQRNMKFWADVADKICFGHTYKFGIGIWFSAMQWRRIPHRASVVRGSGQQLMPGISSYYQQLRAVGKSGGGWWGDMGRKCPIVWDRVDWYVKILGCLSANSTPNNPPNPGSQWPNQLILVSFHYFDALRAPIIHWVWIW